MDGESTTEYESLRGIARVVKGDEDFAVESIRRAPRFEPALRGLPVERVLAAVASVTGIRASTLRSRQRGGQVAEARCLAGYVGKKFAGIPLAATARHLGREESYLLKGVSGSRAGPRPGAALHTARHGHPRAQSREIRISGLTPSGFDTKSRLTPTISGSR
jgi:hypothetical protein